MAAHALIVGATGGIGEAIARQYAERPSLRTLVLCARQATRSARLQLLRDELLGRGVQALLLDADIRDEASLAALRAVLEDKQIDLDLVVNASGLLHAPGIDPEKQLEQIDAAALRTLFDVNALGPILLARALQPWLAKRRRIVYASLSARVGSIDDNRLGGWYGYRASKAAQNQLLKTLAIEMRRRNPEAIVLILHPGTTDTQLSRPFQRNVAQEKLFTTDFVAGRLMAIIDAAGPDDSGRFIGWDGEGIRW
ncbi:MAG: SDR family NAD(P)-dependent oxidoreductase [Burkholderiaceae bacterium]|nr:SDR family NAD(P)-dependent oxidoreductase [Burkholderiaceae bacterium]